MNTLTRVHPRHIRRSSVASGHQHAMRQNSNIPIAVHQSTHHVLSGAVGGHLLAARQCSMGDLVCVELHKAKVKGKAFSALAVYSRDSPNHAPSTHPDVSTDTEGGRTSTTRQRRRVVNASSLLDQVSFCFTRSFRDEPLSVWMDIDEEESLKYCRESVKASADDALLTVIIDDTTGDVAGFTVSEDWAKLGTSPSHYRRHWDGDSLYILGVEEQPLDKFGLLHSICGSLYDQYDALTPRGLRSSAVHLWCTGVMPKYRGMGIGTFSVLANMYWARQRGFKSAVGICTSQVSTKMCETADYHCLHSLSYANIDGVRVGGERPLGSVDLMYKPMI